MPNDQVRRFHELHRAGCFVMPNPWDVGSARLLAQLGFPALATTSSGFAWSLGRPDNHVTLAEAPERQGQERDGVEAQHQGRNPRLRQAYPG